MAAQALLAPEPWRLLSTSLEPGTALLQAPDRIQTAGFIPRSADPSIRASHRALGSPASPLVMLRPHCQGIKLLRVLHSLSGQGQLDGAPCSFSREEKLHCLKRAYQAGVRNSGMDSAVFVAVCRLCGLKGKLFVKASGPTLLFHEVIFTSQEKKKESNYMLLGVEGMPYNCL